MIPPSRIFIVLLAVAAAFSVPGAARAATLEPIAPVVACESLAGTPLNTAVDARVTVSTIQENGYCHVRGTIARAVKFEVRLPSRGWTQRYLQIGCGGLCGAVRLNTEKAESCLPVTDGAIVLATTDMGHQGMDPAWGANADQRLDFAHRGVHLTALAAKALIQAYYGQPPRWSYFSGCSDGGREALMEAQRYPQDFDGIAAGAPALNFSVQNSFHHAWLARANMGANGQAILTGADVVPLHAAVLRACDGLDGLVDGQITNPRGCRFDPRVVECKGAYRAGECLDARQIATVRAIYRGAHTANGKPLEAGPLMPGSELEWVGVFVPAKAGGPIFSARIALDAINNLMFNPNPAVPYTVQTFPFTVAMARELKAARALYNADDPDLSAFAAHGGRLMLWHGWADPHISPINTIAYFDQVGATLGAARRDGFLRMFLMPGMGHCGGGDGPNEFPLLAVLMAWVEDGDAPGKMLAHRPGRSRPVYAYPAVAAYSGKGGIDEAASFVAR